MTKILVHTAPTIIRHGSQHIYNLKSNFMARMLKGAIAIVTIAGASGRSGKRDSEQAGLINQALNANVRLIQL